MCLVRAAGRTLAVPMAPSGSADPLPAVCAAVTTGLVRGND